MEVVVRVELRSQGSLIPRAQSIHTESFSQNVCRIHFSSGDPNLRAIVISDNLDCRTIIEMVRWEQAESS